MLLTDLREVKTLLETDLENTGEDKRLLLLIEMASNWIQEYLGRYDLEKKERTEYYKGTGTPYLLLRYRPVFTTPALQVYVDQQGYFGAASGAFDSSTSLLTYGSDYTLQIDQPDGTSRSAKLIRINSFWPRPYARQPGLLSPFLTSDTGSVKVVYTAGYTVDTLPPVIRSACTTLTASMRYLYPLGLPLSSESYEDRSISTYIEKSKEYLFSQVKPFLFSYRNWSW